MTSSESAEASSDDGFHARQDRPPMDTDKFWRIVDAAKLESGGICQQQVEVTVQKLSQLEPAEIVAFDELMVRLFKDAYRWDLWGAAYLINEGCSDSGFYGFRAWLITQGRQVYEAALRDPDSLADHHDVLRLAEFEVLECEDFLSATDMAYEKVTGQLPSFEYDRPRAVLQGKTWEFDDDREMQRRYPRLWAVVQTRCRDASQVRWDES